MHGLIAKNDRAVI